MSYVEIDRSLNMEVGVKKDQSNKHILATPSVLLQTISLNEALK